MNRSDDIRALAEAIEAVHSSLKPVACNATASDGTPFADYAAIRSALRPKLKKAHLAVVQAGGVESVATLIVHAPTGQWIEAESKTERSIDGGWTHGARHALMLAFGVTQAQPETINGRSAPTLGIEAEIHRLCNVLGLSYGQLPAESSHAQLLVYLRTRAAERGKA